MGRAARGWLGRGEAGLGAGVTVFGRLDLDVFIELEEYSPELRQRISELPWEVGFEMDRVITTEVTTRAELEHGAMAANPLVLNIEREGLRS